MRMFRAVKTGLLVTFITASGIAVAQDEAPPPPQFSTQDEAGPQGAGPQDRGPQVANQNPTPSEQDNQGWRRLGPAPYPQNGGDPRYAQPGQYGDRRYAPPPAPANVPPQLT